MSMRLRKACLGIQTLGVIKTKCKKDSWFAKKSIFHSTTYKNLSFLQQYFSILGSKPPMFFKYFYRLLLKSFPVPRVRLLQLCFFLMGGKPPDPSCILNIPIDFQSSLFLLHGWDSCNCVCSYWGGGTQDPPMLVKHPYYRLPVKSILAPRARFLQLCLLILGGKPLRPMYSFNIPIDFHLSLYLFQGRDSCNSVSSSWGVNPQTPLSN